MCSTPVLFGTPCPIRYSIVRVQIPCHRLYRAEVVQVHGDVSFILLVPPTADVCSAPCSRASICGREFFEQSTSRLEEARPAKQTLPNGCQSLSIPVFEMGPFDSWYLHTMYVKSSQEPTCRKSSNKPLGAYLYNPSTRGKILNFFYVNRK